MKAWFRTIAAMFSSSATAQTMAGISVLAIAIYTGLPFIILACFRVLNYFGRRVHDSQTIYDWCFALDCVH